MIGTAASTTVLAAPSLASAQSTSATRLSPLRGCCALGYTEWDVDTASSLWRVAANAADIARSMPRGAESVWRRSQVTLSHNAGSSYRPQEAAATSTAELVAEGGQSRGRWSTYGRVGYERRQDRDVRWRHTADAYDGMQYQWADSIGGTFGRDVLTISTAFASPAWRGWRAGMSSTLGLGQGARQNDPRPLTRRRIAEWAPGLKWTRGRQTLGVSYQREWLREDLEVGGGTSSEYPSIFRLRGMVTFDRTQLISGERALFATGNGGTMAYAYEGTTWTTATSVTIRRVAGETRDGIAAPVTGGTSRLQRYGGRLVVSRTPDRQVDQSIAPTRRIELDASLIHETSRGTDPIFAAVNAIDEGWSAPLWLTWRWRTGLAQDRARLSVGIRGSGLSRRDVAASSRWQVTTWAPSALVARRLGGDGGRWSVDLQTSYLHTANAALVIPFPSRTSEVLARDDARVMQASRWTGAAGATYDVMRDRQRWARARMGLAVLNHHVIPLSERRARGRAAWTFSWELL